jgi:hypothetical protein
MIIISLPLSFTVAGMQEYPAPRRDERFSILLSVLDYM